ncbi:hypothetical protein M231_02558 [Tremella mesenterica]|uniref:NADH dehydrogenase (Ubiquinone) 1 alpha subcomplex 4 n=1 Tax=Tremella mesenterica TaxID=5217 RepID=A0A4Q1BQ93_TREME|nr:uncharacterized protein TREMEDRAFT_71384 [Tremella mesenterica DSM 1558]EIW70786.1 hypothetical protein TREMEDRAFT_71384 [Tremella mesenterica DSM 1558]RXK40101.1 hypothetical protein M231_02558 [Tremella mesenterica]
MASARAFLRKWVPVEVYPIIAVVGVAVGGATFYLARLSQHSEVVWDRSGDWRPWDKVKQDQNVKFLSYNKDFWEKRKLGQGEKSMVDAI